MSKEWEDLKKYFETLPKVSVSYEFHEQTPMQRYPLLQRGEKFYCYSETLLSFSVQNIVYDIIRSVDIAKFMEKFGFVFERYIEDSINFCSLTFYTEAQLKQSLNPEEKLIDFVITETSSNVFIDAKGVELAYLGMISHLPNVITDKTRSSIIKGVEQYYSTVNQIINSGFMEVSNKENYLLIVTYKDLYLGNGTDFFEEVAKEKYQGFINKYPNCRLLKTQNIYFISVDDFDLLIEFLKTSDKTISDVLEYAVHSDKDYQTKRFVFRQHLIDLDKTLNNVSYLKEEFDKIADRCATKIHST
jgi:hypothetical protein